MFGIFGKLQTQPKKVDPKEQPNQDEYLANVGKCVGAGDMIPPALFFTAGGIGAAATARTVMEHPDELDPLKFGALVGTTIGSITIGSILSARVAKKANDRYDIMTGLAAREARTADIFQAILESELCKGEKSFMAIVNLLDGVSDADKANLRRRYQEYNEQRLSAAASAAAQQLDNGAGGAPAQPQTPPPPQSPPQQNTSPAADGSAAK